jgi:O-antigen/teichoic acid export membrane protein
MGSRIKLIDATMLRTVFFGWGAKLISIIFGFINIRILFDLIDVDGYAAYALLVSATTWVALLNFSLPIAGQNLVSKWRAEDRAIGPIISTILSILPLMLFFLVPIVALLSWGVSKAFFSGYTFVSYWSIFSVLILMLLAALSNILSQLLFALHRPDVPNMLPALQALLLFTSLNICVQYDIRDFNSIAAISYLPGIVCFIVLIVNFRDFCVWTLDRQVVVCLVKSIKGLFLFSVLAATTLSVDYFVMSRVLQPHDIAIYSLASKLYAVILVVYTVILASTWSPASDLLNNRKFSEARSLIMKILAGGFLIAIVACACLMASKSFLIPFASGGKLEDISIPVCLAFSLYIFVRVWSDTFSMALLSVNQIKIVNIYIPIQALISVTAQIYLGGRFGAAGIVMGMVISFLLTAAWILPFYFYQLTKVQLHEQH